MMFFEEPRIEDLLADPLIRLVMSSDGVEEADIRDLIGRSPAQDGRAATESGPH